MKNAMKYFISAMILLLLPCVYARADESVVIAVDQDNPPFMYKDASTGSAKGLYPELISAVFEHMGKSAKIVAYPWKRALELGERGEAGIGGIYKNDARLKVYDYSDPIFDEKLQLYVKKGKGFTFSGISDLRGKTIGVIRGWSYGDAFDKAKGENLFKVEENNADEPNFQKLMLGRVDCVIAIEQAAQQVVAAHGYKDQIETLQPPVATNPTYVVFGKTANKRELLDQFNSSLKAMKQDGSYSVLIKDFFEKEASK